jgi:hypothetical protein
VETDAPVLTGYVSRTPLLLRQKLRIGEAVHFAMRLPLYGVTNCSLYEDGSPRWTICWVRDALLHSRIFVKADGRDIPIVEIPERKSLEWMTVELQLREKQIDLVVDGRLTGVAPLKKPLQACRFGIHVVRGRVAQFKDVWVCENSN